MSPGGQVSSTRYLPPTLAEELDPAFLESWFGKHLASMEEPALWEERAATGYRSRLRMLVLPSFSQPYVIGVDRQDDGHAAWRYVRTSGMGGYDAGPIEERRGAALAREKLLQVDAALDEARFTDRLIELRRGREFADSPEGEGSVWLDGTQLVFELVNEAGHHLVTRHEGALDPSMRALTGIILSIADISQG